MIAELQTTRLLLRPLELADAEQAQPLFSQWEVVRFLGGRVPWPYPPDGALTHYRDIALPAMDRGEQWHWSLRLKGTPGQLIGCIGLMRGEESNRGFWLGAAWHGQGLMSEAADAVTDYWFGTLQFPVLRVPKAVLNTASRRISEKQGMRVISTKEKEYVCGLLKTEVWEITADEWRARRQNQTL